MSLKKAAHYIIRKLRIHSLKTVAKFEHLLACVASVPVLAERNNRAARFRTRGKWGESKKGERGGWGRGNEGTLARRPLNSEKRPPTFTVDFTH